MTKGPGERVANLVLDEELDTLDGGSGGLGDGSGNTTHCRVLVSSPCSDAKPAGIHIDAIMLEPNQHREETYSGSRPRRAARSHR